MSRDFRILAFQLSSPSELLVQTTTTGDESIVNHSYFCSGGEAANSCGKASATGVVQVPSDSWVII